MKNSKYNEQNNEINIVIQNPSSIPLYKIVLPIILNSSGGIENNFLNDFKVFGKALNSDK